MVALATAVNLLHGVSHVGQEVLSLQAWQWAYVTCVIFLTPVVAAVLLWSPYRLAGAWLLFGSMAGSLVFDLAYHFLIEGPTSSSPWSRARGLCRSRSRPCCWSPRADSECWSVDGRCSGSRACGYHQKTPCSQRRDTDGRDDEPVRLAPASRGHEARGGAKPPGQSPAGGSQEAHVLAGVGTGKDGRSPAEVLPEAGFEKRDTSVTRLLLAGLQCGYPG